MNIITGSLWRISFKTFEKRLIFLFQIFERSNGHYMACIQSKCWRCLVDIPYVHHWRAGSHWFEIWYHLNQDQNGKAKALSSPRRTDGLLTALSTVVYDLILWLSTLHLSKMSLKLKILLILKSLLLTLVPWPSPWNRKRRKIKNKTLRQTRLLHFSNSQLPLRQ